MMSEASRGRLADNLMPWMATKKPLVVLKLGGSSLQDLSVLTQVTKTISDYRKYGYQVVLVHGGGPAINAELTRRGITWQFINGQRQTTPEMMKVIEEVLFGQMNQSLVDALNAAGIPAVGFSGAENNTLLCTQTSIELGQVGLVQSVNPHLLSRALQQPEEFVPVLAPIGVGRFGEKYNINADWAACKLAGAMKADKLIFLTDQFGILDQEGVLISKISAQSLLGLVEDKVVTGGMYTKVMTILDALKSGVKQVRVMSGQQAVDGLWSDFIGTVAHE